LHGSKTVSSHNSPYSDVASDFSVLINCLYASRGGMCERLKQAVLKTA
jgi:hypothetical protein